MTLAYALPFFVLLALHHDAGAQDPCLNPNNKRGTCINIRNCPQLVEILRRPRPLPAALHDFLVRSQCGFDGMVPKVCCETQVTVTESTVTQAPVTQAITTPTTPTPESRFPNPPDITNHPNIRLLPESICGPVTQSKIVGGNRTRVLDYPWMALVGYDTGKPTREYLCGGTVISERYVLTAAHCVTALRPGVRLMGVRLGEHDLNTERDCDYDEFGVEEVCTSGYRDYGLEKVHFHPGFSTTELQNDIGLIRVNTNIDFSPLNIKPICLPIGDGATIISKKVTVAGWGTTELGVRSSALLKVLLPQVSVDECQNAYRNRQIWYKQMCAGGNKSMDSCSGDSGGPLQAPGLYKGNFRFVQHGIVSYGLRNCGTEGFPGVYTKIVYYLDWILNTMTV